MRCLLLFLCACAYATEYKPTYPNRRDGPHNFRIIAKTEDQRYAVVKTDRVRVYRRRCGCYGRCTCREKRNLLYVDSLTAKEIVANSSKEPPRPCPTGSYNERTTEREKEQ